MSEVREQVTLVQAISELYAFNPRKKKGARIEFEISVPGETVNCRKFGKHYDSLFHEWSYYIKDVNCPYLGSEEKHFVSNLLTGSFAAQHMRYAAQQGKYVVTRII